MIGAIGHTFHTIKAITVNYCGGNWGCSDGRRMWIKEGEVSFLWAKPLSSSLTKQVNGYHITANSITRF